MSAPITTGSMSAGYSAIAPYLVAPCPRCGLDERWRHRRELCSACKCAGTEATRVKALARQKAQRARKAGGR